VRLSKPPFLATWLLNHFLPGSENDHIIGDLMEAYDAGRSRTWYWKEVIAAITIGVSKKTVKQPLLALRAMTFGWGSWLLFYYIVAPKVLNPVFKRIFTPSGYPFSLSRLTWLVTTLLVLVGGGWIVARLHRATVVLFALSFSINQLRNLPWIWSTATNSLTNTRFLPYFIFELEVQLLFPAAIVLGGLLTRTNDSERVDLLRHPSHL
jgi:hypothetical protein